MKIKKLLSFVLAICIFASVCVSADISAFAIDINNTFNDNKTDLAIQILNSTDTESSSTLSTQPESQPETQAPTSNNGSVIYDESKVGKVGKLYKNTKYTDKIQFNWDKVEGAEGYRVYYKNNDSGNDFRLLITTSHTSIAVINLMHTTPYEFKVAAYVTEGDTIYEGKAQIGKTATQPAKMGTPSLKKSSSSIKISWKKNSRADGYRIYRQDSTTNGKLKLYKTIKGSSTTSYDDKNVKKGKAYNYQVRAYREMYKDKIYLGEGSTLRTVAGLCKPGLVSATSQVRRVSIEWKKNSVAQGYDIYYKADDRSSYKLLKSTKKTFITTDRLRAGHEYNFRIKPYKLVGAKKTKVYGTQLSVTKKATTTAYGKKIGNTYIEISLKDQRMRHYVDGKLYVDTYVVTGNYPSSTTPTGAYKIWQRIKGTNLSGPTWSCYVDYWLAFTKGGCGIHDSSWRSSSEYGGTTYKGNGSHGCVNTPKSAVAKIFNKAKIGTYVVVY